MSRHTAPCKCKRRNTENLSVCRVSSMSNSYYDLLTPKQDTRLWWFQSTRNSIQNCPGRQTNAFRTSVAWGRPGQGNSWHCTRSTPFLTPLFEAKNPEANASETKRTLHPLDLAAGASSRFLPLPPPPKKNVWGRKGMKKHIDIIDIRWI